MLKLYKNKKQSFECKVEVEGADYSKAKPRLLFFPNNDNRNIFFEGVIEGNSCKILVTPNLDIPKSGKVMLEVIIDDGTVFQPWSSTYEIIVEQVKVQSESISLSFEQSAPSIKVVESVTLKDDKNRVIEPKKASVKMIEQKITEEADIEPKNHVEQVKSKKDLFLEHTDDNTKKKVNEFLGTVYELGKKEKKALLEHITKNYKPSIKASAWTKSIFLEHNSLASKIAQYCYDLEEKKGK